MWNMSGERVWSRPNSARRFERLESRLALTAGPTVVDFEVGSTQWNADFTDYLVASNQCAHGYRIPLGTLAQSTPLPWSNIDTIVVTFSEDVVVASRHLSMSGVGVASVSVQDFSYNPATFTAIWTLSAPLSRNSYLVEIDGDGVAPVANLGKVSLDGDWSPSQGQFPSGNGQPGGDFAFAFRVLPGDNNQNGGVDYFDYFEVSAKVGLSAGDGGYSPFHDLDGDGDITSADSSGVGSRLWTAIPAGTPVGQGNDAPSTTGGGYYRLPPGTPGLQINLWSDFYDAETPASQLTFAIVSATNSALWDSQSVDASTGTLDLQVKAHTQGRSTLIVRATDASGQSIITRYVIDVGPSGPLPTLTYSITSTTADTWRVAGSVMSEGDLAGLLVKFSGAINRSARVAADGTFEFWLSAIEEDWGEVIGSVEDWDGARSDEVFRYLGLF